MIFIFIQSFKTPPKLHVKNEGKVMFTQEISQTITTTIMKFIIILNR